jgi:hypothetical protein
MDRNPKSQEYIDRINNIGLTVDPEQLREAFMQRIRDIDGEIAGVLMMVVEFDNPDEPVHQTGATIEDTLEFFETRRNRILDYLTESLSDDTIEQATLPGEDEPTQIVPPEQAKDEE